MSARQTVQLVHAFLLAMLVAFVVLALPHIIECHMGGCETEREARAALDKSRQLAPLTRN